MNYEVIESVWLATAIMAYEKFFRAENLTIEQMYFKQSDIQKRAQTLTTNKVDAARISQWTNAAHGNNTHNFLCEGDNRTRRLSYKGEFGGEKETPKLNASHIVETSLGSKTVGDIYKFVNEDYTSLFTINFFTMLDYLDQYSTLPNPNPESASNAFSELNKFALIVGEKYGLQNKIKSNWLTGGNNRIPSYFWEQLKFEEFKSYPSSISIFAERAKDDSNKARLRITVELDEKFAHPVDYERHHKFLNEPILVSGLSYFVKERATNHNYHVYDEDAETIKRKLEEGIYKKIQLTYVLTYEDIRNRGMDNAYIFSNLLEGIKLLIPFYKLATDYGKSNPGDDNVNYSKNMILYGPPGTGKTYNTVNYAVSVIENKKIKQVQAEEYKNVFERYISYKKDGQVGFITFHQSYGYEEFIEGIKPVLNDEQNEQVTYKIEPGAFKEFCENAQQLKIISDNKELDLDTRVWKISLGGSSDKGLKDDCFKNNRIRIGWDDLGKGITEETEYPNTSVLNILTNFYDEMSVGDIIFSLGNLKHIDAIGIVTGEPEWLEDEKQYKRSRKVEWLAKNIWEYIYDLNGKTNLTLASVYELRRLSIEDVNQLILKHSKYTVTDVDIVENKKNYIFIIDEINRGNISKIFGELITLIEPTKRIGAEEETKVKLPYSKKEFGVPQNVYLLGTMNTADRSIALMDTALRRRFNFIEMMPDTQVLAGTVVAAIDIQKMVETMNQRIEVLYDRDHTIGHAYFISLKETPSIQNLASIFKNAIIPLLQEYFYEDYSKIQLVLGDNAKESDFKFILDEKLKVKDVFKGNPDVDLPEKKYKIQTEAFMNPKSYIGIYE